MRPSERRPSERLLMCSSAMCVGLLRSWSVGLYLIDDQAEERVVVGVGKEPAEVNAALFAMCVAPAIKRKPCVGGNGVAGDGATQRFFVTADIEFVSVWIDEVVFVSATDRDAMVDMTDDVGAGRAIHIAFFG